MRGVIENEKKNVVLTIPEPRKTALDERPWPKIVPGYSMIKVEIAPICIEHQVYRDHTMEWHSDAYNQGHEGVGTICEVLPGSKFKVGDRVIIYQGQMCGECFVCKRNLSPTHCLAAPYELLTETQDPNAPLTVPGYPEIKTMMDIPLGMHGIEMSNDSPSGGYGFVQYRIAPDNMLQLMPDSLPWRYAALANCSLGCTYTAFEEEKIGRGSWVVIAGVGFIGFGALINAKYRGANVIVLGRNPYRMEQAKKMGADYIVNPDDEDWLEQIHELTDNLYGADLVIEASGYPYYQKKALACVRRFGTVWIYGFLVESSEPLPIRLLDEIHNRGVKLTGSHDVFVSHREGLLKMLQAPDVQEWSNHLITHEFNMSEATPAFDAALSKKAGKIFLYPHENCPQSGPTNGAANPGA